MATKVGYDMESIAVDIKTNLAGQSEKLEKVQSRLADINSETNIANRHLGDIKKARALNKTILYGVLVMLAVAFLVVMLIKFT